MMRISLAGLAIGLAAVLAVASAEAPVEGVILFPTEPSFGSNMHTHHNGKDMAAIGVNWARVDFSWNGMESKARGQYNFEYEGMEDVLADYRAHDMRVLGMLAWQDYCGKFYPDPNTDEGFAAGVAGFARWAGACADHFKGRVDIWEIANEPEAFPVGNVNQPQRYTQLARATARAIRAADPDAHVGALSTAWMDRGFISTCLALGLLDDRTIDVLTFHGYHRANLMPESGLAEDVAWLRGMIRKHAPRGHKVIVVDSERGYAIVPFLQPKRWSSWRNFVYTEAEQAAYLARHYLEEIHLGIEVSIWYKDMFGEVNFSLYRGGPGSALRPMGHVMRNLAKLLDTNPKQLANHKYDVSLVDLPDQVPDPNAVVRVRSFLRTHLTADESVATETLVIAMWNPVEAFNGRILDSRKRIEDDYYEAWRAISPDDVAEVPVQLTIGQLAQERVSKSQRHDLLATEAEAPRSAVKLTFSGKRATTETLNVGPFPTVVVLELDAE